MIHYVELQNYRSCRKLEFRPSEKLTVLVGRNGAGKTNIMRGIKWIADCASNLTQPFSSSFLDRPTRGQIEFSCNDIRFRYTVTTTYLYKSPEGPTLYIVESLEKFTSTETKWAGVFERDGSKIILSSGKQLNIPTNTTAIPALVSIVTDDPEASDAHLAHTFLSGVRYCVVDEPNSSESPFGSIILEREYLKWKSTSDELPERSQDFCYRILELYKERPATLDELKMLIGNNGLGIIDNIVVTQLPSDSDLYFISFRVRDAGASLAFPELSLGTRRMLRLLLSIINDDSTLTMLEHPEEGIHAGLLHKLFNLLKQYKNSSQLIIATHASTVINLATPDQIRFVLMSDHGTDVRPLTPEELSVAIEYMEDEGSLSDFLEIAQDE